MKNIEQLTGQKKTEIEALQKPFTEKIKKNTRFRLLKMLAKLKLYSMKRREERYNIIYK